MVYGDTNAGKLTNYRATIEQNVVNETIRGMVMVLGRNNEIEKRWDSPRTTGRKGRKVVTGNRGNNNNNKSTRHTTTISIIRNMDEDRNHERHQMTDGWIRIMCSPAVAN